MNVALTCYQWTGALWAQKLYLRCFVAHFEWVSLLFFFLKISHSGYESLSLLVGQEKIAEMFVNTTLLHQTTQLGLLEHALRPSLLRAFSVVGLH